MPFELPNDDALYQALLVRDCAYEGRAYVAVTTTRVFCRLTCPARKPKRNNCLFFRTVAACMEAGFRPCKRCRPLISAAEVDPLVRTLIEAMENNPTQRWSEQRIIAMGLEPSTVRRVFKRHFDITFLEMARLRRVRHAVSSLTRGASVIEAQFAAGFESASGFRDALARVLGRSPSEVSQGAGLNADWLETPLGAMLAVTDRHALYLLEFFDRKQLPKALRRLQAKKGAIGIGRYAVTDQVATELRDYFAGAQMSFKTPVAQLGSDFTRVVWTALGDIPLGQTRNYSEIAQAVGRPAASRAVARANAANPIAVMVPCHRVIGADGSLTGYGGGRWRKQWLIDHERQMVSQTTTIRAGFYS